MSADVLDDLDLFADPGMRPDVPAPRPRRWDVVAIAERLLGDVIFLLAALGSGIAAGAVIVGGVMLAAALAAVAGVVVVHGLPFLLFAVVATWLGSRLLRRFAPALHGRLPRLSLRRPLRRVAIRLARASVAALTRWLLRLRGLARRGRARVATRSGRHIPTAYRPAPAGRLGALHAILTDPATWRDLAYVLLSPAFAFAAAVLAGMTWAGGVALLTTPLSLGTSPTSPGTWVAISAGLTMLLLAPLVTHLLTNVVTGLSVSLLMPGEGARMRVEAHEQRLRRQLAVDAAERERRRIERDLHDGAQQRLVALGITLGLAREALPADPTAGADLVEEAHDQAKLALSELRDLARGIHPAILGDRGLDAALSDLVRRTPIPASILVAVARRPPTAVESAAYFVVSEALTNIARHSGASRITISITHSAGCLVVEVVDDGVGGADPALGTGLVGLADRIEALDGRMTLDSPLGGPTTITAEIPCGS